MSIIGSSKAQSLVRVVGLDPSLSNWGICRALVDIDTLEIVRIEDLQLVSTSPEKDKTVKKVVRKNSEDLGRAKLLHAGLMSATKDCSIAIAEVPVGSQSARAMASYGMCVGILAACPVPLIEVNPAEVKMAAVGDKQAAKEEMIQWGMDRYPGAPWIMRMSKGKSVPQNCNEHLADAIAAIEAGLQTQQFAQAAALMRSMRLAA